MRRFRAPVAALAATALVVLVPGAAAAGETSPVDDLVGQLQDTLQPPAQSQQESPLSGVTDQLGELAPGSAGGTQSVPSSDAPAPSTDDDLPGHETEDPRAPDHAGSEVADADLAEEDVADVGHNDATVEDDDSTTADSTLLALGGQEVLGTHADSNGENETHFGDPLAPVCEGSSGQVCLRVLYADAWASDDGSTSHSRSQSGIATACVGGSNTDPAAECDGPVDVGVSESESEATRDQESGRTTAGSSSHVAGVCLQRDPVTGACALGADAVHSEGQSDSGSSPGSASRDSYVLGLVAQGEDVARVEDPTAVALQPECAEPSLVCVFLNQGETYVGDGIAGHAQEALSAGVLPDPLGLFVDLGRTETLVHNDGGEPAANTGDDTPPGAAGAEVAGVGRAGNNAGGAVVGGVSGVLPNTGGVWSGLLAAALFAIAGGAFFIAYSRRRLAARA